jgi:hypothetical protein
LKWEAYNIILATGIFSSACRKWWQLKETKRTWRKFQDLFKEASIDQRYDVVAEEFTNQPLHQANFAQVDDKMSMAQLAVMFQGNTTPPTDVSTPATPMNVPASEAANISAITVTQMEDLVTSQASQWEAKNPPRQTGHKQKRKQQDHTGVPRI